MKKEKSISVGTSLKYANWWIQIFLFPVSRFSRVAWYLAMASDLLPAYQRCFFPPPPGRPAERQRPADCGERRVAAGPLQPRRHGGAEALHVVGGQLPGNHPAGGAARPPPGTMQEKSKLKNQKKVKSKNAKWSL